MFSDVPKLTDCRGGESVITCAKKYFPNLQEEILKKGCDWFWNMSNNLTYFL